MFAYLKTHRSILLASLLATIAFTFYELNPHFGPYVSTYLIPIYLFNNWIGMIVLWLLAVSPILLYALAITLIFYLLQIKQFASSALAGFAFNYSFTTIMTVLIPLTLIAQIGEGIVVFCAFLLSIHLCNKNGWRPTVVAICGGIIMVFAFYVSPNIENQIATKKYTVSDNTAFLNAVKTANFTAYYPTYESSLFPVTPAKFNGYTKQLYSNETVTFLLDKAQVRESASLIDQEKVMNFTTDCDVIAILGSMEVNTRISDSDLKASLDNYQKCDLIGTTESGKKVYFKDNGQTTYFYILIKNTNVIISFDTLNTQKYDKAQLPEILKIIDSLQPLAPSKLQKGNQIGIGFD